MYQNRILNSHAQGKIVKWFKPFVYGGKNCQFNSYLFVLLFKYIYKFLWLSCSQIKIVTFNSVWMLKTRTVETFESKVVFCFVVLRSFHCKDATVHLKRSGGAFIKVNAEAPSSSDLNSCLLIQHNLLFVCLIALSPGRLL